MNDPNSNDDLTPKDHAMGNEPMRDIQPRSIEETFEIFSQVSEAPEQQQEMLLQTLCHDVSLQQKIRKMLGLNSVVDPLLDQSLVPEPFDFLTNDRIENFKLQHELGRGGMGVVFLADQLEPIQRKVALKVIKPGVDTEEVIARFEAERHALSLMDHPNIATVLDAGTTAKQRPFFVMELVNGSPITEYCEEKQLSISERLELFIPVCNAIQHAHQKGIIHRDVKPSNVLVTEYDGQPLAKVIDFGVAKATNQSLSERTLATGLGQIIGTFDYMSPEQSQVGQRDVDTRSDIYSLGVLLYELLTGRPPFDRDRLRSVDWEEMLRIIREEEPPRPSTRILELTKLATHTDQVEHSPKIRSVPRELDWIVLKAVEKNPDRRYATPNDFANDIACFLNGKEVSACPPSRLYRFRKFAKRNKVAIATTAIVAASLVIGMVGTSWQARRASRAEHAFRQASEFFAQDLVVLAGPDVDLSSDFKPDPNLQLLIFLNHLLERVDYRFENQPQVKANLKASLSHSFNILGRHDDASRLCREYLDFLHESKGSRHPDSIRVVRQLISFYLDESRLDEVEALIPDALAGSREVFGEEHEVTLQLQTDLANLYHQQERFQLAQQTHLDCLATKQRFFGDDHVETLLSKSKLAVTYESLHRFDEAEKLHRQVLHSNKQREGTRSNLRVAASLNNLGKCYLNRGIAENDPQHFVEAKTLLNDGMVVYPDTLEIKSNLAHAHMELGQFMEAQRLLIDVEQRLNVVVGPADNATLEAGNLLGVCYLNQNRLSIAEYFFKKTYEALQQKNPSSLQTMQVMGNLAIAYRKMGKLEESIALDERHLEIIQSNTNRDQSDALATNVRLGVSYLDVGKTWEGREKLAAMFQAQSQKRGLYRVAGELADSFFDEESVTAKLYQQTRIWTQRQMENATLHQNEIGLAKVLVECGVRQLRMEAFADAEATLQRSLAIFDSQREYTNDQSMFQAKLFLAEALSGQQKYQTAEAVLEAALKQLGKSITLSPNQKQTLAVDTAEQLIKIQMFRGDSDGVKKWRQKRAEILLAKIKE